jgi:hypothetical protein
MSDLTDIHDAFAQPISYAGVTIAPKAITAVKSDVPAEAFLGPGRTVRHVSFEIQQADLPRRPKKGDTITEEGGRAWSVINATDRDDVVAWEVAVEKA